MLWMISVFCLGLTMVLCILGTLHHCFQDNLLQRAGMALLALSCVARGSEILLSQAVNPQSFLLHLSIALFAVGAAVKYWMRYRRAQRSSACRA